MNWVDWINDMRTAVVL